jgi:hypothetical protein
VLAATRHRVEILFATLTALSLHGYESDTSPDLRSSLVRLSEEHSDVISAAARAQHEPSERNLEALRVEVLESIDIGAHVSDLTAAELCGGRSRQLAYR